MKMMPRMLASVLILCCWGLSPAHALEDQSPEAIVADTFVGRPACFCATVVGTVCFVVSLPFAALSKSVDKAAENLVAKPAKATFTRPLGDFSSLR